MTDNKPIARYGYGTMMNDVVVLHKDNNGKLVMLADHESAIAEKDARIAELEQRLRKPFCPACNSVGMSNCSEFDRCGGPVIRLEVYESLRAAIEAKAREWTQRDAAPQYHEMYVERAAEIRALLEEGK